MNEEDSLRKRASLFLMFVIPSAKCANNALYAGECLFSSVKGSPYAISSGSVALLLLPLLGKPEISPTVSDPIPIHPNPVS
ncbi:hypothetical protein F5Y14DRAFT_397643 [Nemania sp. NC0429]|nr:hypothetical protein F5Y14DRAFT_397643 [Nemania sp. NC0429]